MKRIVCIFLVCPMLASCSTSGTMHGMIRGSGERITMTYEQAARHDDLQVTLPDGETFKGKVVMEASRASGSTGAAVGVVATTYTGTMRGVLFGDKGHTMVCNFQYADSGYAEAGGVGLCETSDGKVIDVQW